MVNVMANRPFGSELWTEPVLTYLNYTTKNIQYYSKFTHLHSKCILRSHLHNVVHFNPVIEDTLGYRHDTVQ